MATNLFACRSDDSCRTVSRNRRAFTLIEVLVVIAIIGLLTALLLPAVQAARASSIRLACANNLKQFGIALNSYNADHGALPAGVAWGMYSLHSAVLPYLEQSSVAHSINFQVFSLLGTASDGVNATISRSAISAFLCPADGSEAFPGWGQTNYAGNSGYDFASQGFNGTFYNSSGLFGKLINYQSVTDGTSHTIAMSEWVKGPGAETGHDILISTFDVFKQRKFDEFVDACRRMTPSSSSLTNGKPSRWLLGASGCTLYDSSLLPNERSCLNGGIASDGTFAAGSRHVKGVNVLFIDGHTSFVRNSINQAAWRALSTRAGQEIAEDY